MANPLFFSPNFNQNWDVHGSLDQGFGNGEATDDSKQDFGIEDLEELCSTLGLFQDDFNGEQNQQTSPHCFIQNNTNQYEMSGNLQTNHVSEIGKPVKEKPNPFLLASLELLNSYGRGSKRSKEMHSSNPIDKTMVQYGQSMSMDEILTLAAERYMQFSTRRVDGLSTFIHPYGSAFAGLPMEETRDVELVHLLLVAADQVAAQQYDLASGLISRCRSNAFCLGNSAQRLVFYFAEALQDRIDSATGGMTTQRKNERIRAATDLGLGTNPEFLAWHQKLPFSQVTQIVGIQAILENVRNATKIHLIDLEIRSGIQWTAFMQALKERRDGRIKYLKITAVGTKDRHKIEETGKRLMSFAKSMHLPFTFHVVFFPDMRSVKQIANVEADETVAVYCSSVLRAMISTPDCLDNVMKAIRSARPSILVVIEVEANHNSPLFLNRFTEALFFHAAFFDSLEDCMERDDQYRLALERIHLGEGIRNIIAAEGEERVNRNVKIDVWRAFFARFRMEEIELSESSIYQANLVLKQFARGEACNLDRNGDGLIIGWKGTPISSLTTWKFL